jgi:hypothetical protein
MLLAKHNIRSFFTILLCHLVILFEAPETISVTPCQTKESFPRVLSGSFLKPFYRELLILFYACTEFIAHPKPVLRVFGKNQFWKFTQRIMNLDEEE